jgi:phosphatidylserine decarboxylase
MRIPLARNSWGWIIGPVAGFGLIAWGFHSAGMPRTALGLMCCGVVLSLFMIFFHRDPRRVCPQGDDLILAGADGRIRRVERVNEPHFMEGESQRVSIFLSPFNVHMNRAPVGGAVRRLEYTPGRHALTIRNVASEINEHSSILIDSSRGRCLVRQIVGPVVRRVVHWLEEGQTLKAGETFGMMRFGSRLDIYLPVDGVAIEVEKGDRVRAGETVIGRFTESNIT